MAVRRLLVHASALSCETSTTLQCRESKVCGGFSHEFGVVRLYRTFSNRIFTGYLYASSGLFNRSEPPRTFSNNFSAEKARCVEVFRMSSGWFDYRTRCVEVFSNRLLTGGTGCVGYLCASGSTAANLLDPSRTTSVQRKQGV